MFAGFLKQSIAATVRVGPFVDATDGGTPETALALATGEAYLYKPTGAGVDIAARTWAHTFNGLYDLSLSVADTDTVGNLAIVIRDSAGRPSRIDYTVLAANVFDSLIGATDKLLVDVAEINGNVSSGFLSGTDHLKSDITKISGSAGAADNLEAGALALVSGTINATTSTTTTLKTDLSASSNDFYNGRTLTFTSGALAGQSTSIEDYNGTSKDLTVTALTAAPANGVTFTIA